MPSLDLFTFLMFFICLSKTFSSQGSYYLFLHVDRLSFTLESWAGFLVLWVPFIHGSYLKRSQPGVYILNLYGLRAACCWWSVHSCRDKQQVAVHASTWAVFAPSSQCCILAVAQHCPSLMFNFWEIFNVLVILMVHGCKQTSTRMHTHLSNAFLHRLAPTRDACGGVFFEVEWDLCKVKLLQQKCDTSLIGWKTDCQQWKSLIAHWLVSDL